MFGRRNELMESIREELRLTREMHERHKEMHERHQEALEREFALNRAEFEKNRISAEREHELNRREHQETRAAVQNLREVCRVLVLRIEENTQVLRDLRGEIRAQTEGLMRVLDEFRGRGPGGEPAAS